MVIAIKVPKEKLLEAKEFLAVIAMKDLEKCADIFEFENTKVEFGYIYLRDNEYESLFKVMTDKKTAYFALQQGELMRLQDTFNDELFQGTIDGMTSLHGDWI
ncbi:MAG: hypothetical protein ACJA1C_003117 [Crocinitomicaceae bacterium]|jgi:hypothetical protein